MARSDKFTALSRQVVYYSDFRNNIETNPQTGYLAVLQNAEAVINSIRNLVLTNKFERFYQPHVGSKVQSLLFDLNDNPTHELLLNTIKETIRSFEPRVRDLNVQVNQVIDADQISIGIAFSMINLSQPINFNLLLTRAR